jgi:(2Fe-2S) ferredoxin
LKKDGQTVCWALEKALSDRNLSQQVTIKKTGCMKQCKTGPHLLVMPDKAHYSRVQPEMMARVVEQHIVPHLQENSAEHQGQNSLVLVQ